MYILEKIKKEIAEKINKALEQDLVKASDFVYPPNPAMGDLSLPGFDLAKKLGKSPVEIADWLFGSINADEIISGTKIAGPYLNFTLNKSILAKSTIAEINKRKNEYGMIKQNKKKRIMIEFSNANTHKEYHIGHLRNISFGDSITRILAANGHDVIPVSYINDFGIHVAKTLWAYMSFYKEAELPENKGEFLGKVYVRSVSEMDQDPIAKEKVSFMMRKIESRQGEEYRLWEKTRKWSIEAFAKIYEELGVKFNQIFYESEFIDEGIKKVKKLYEKGFLIKSAGAIIKDLSEFKLGAMLFLRSDGTALYPVADVPLAMEKIKKFKLDQSIYVVDNRQGLYFQQLFKVMGLLGFKAEMKHLQYDFVKLPGGMMSSRTGNVITYRELRSLVFDRAKEETKKRHQDWSEKKISATANAIVNGALKFEMIKVGTDQVITFDINQALRFDGFTAAYMQYTYARINSIIKKAEEKIDLPSLDYARLDTSEEKDLVFRLAKYSEAVKSAGIGYDPSIIAKYLFDLARQFNDYYHQTPILKTEKEIRDARLALIIAVGQVIKNGLELLGIEVVNEM